MTYLPERPVSSHKREKSPENPDFSKIRLMLLMEMQAVRQMLLIDLRPSAVRPNLTIKLPVALLGEWLCQGAFTKSARRRAGSFLFILMVSNKGSPAAAKKRPLKFPLRSSP
jgi:hypothetical protein